MQRRRRLAARPPHAQRRAGDARAAARDARPSEQLLGRGPAALCVGGWGQAAVTRGVGGEGGRRAGQMRAANWPRCPHQNYQCSTDRERNEPQQHGQRVTPLCSPNGRALARDRSLERERRHVVSSAIARDADGALWGECSEYRHEYRSKQVFSLNWGRNAIGRAIHSLGTCTAPRRPSGAGTDRQAAIRSL